MATRLDGPVTWSGKKDDEGHRTYEIIHRVESGVLDGPKAVMDTAGLPTAGSSWSFDNDSDSRAYCYPGMEVTPENSDGEPNRFWTVKQTFSTKPLERCSDTEIDNPLLEPAKISGGFVKYTKEVAVDKDLEPILNSAHEPIKGALVEFDHHHPTVQIEINVAELELDVFSDMVNTVNDATLWGLAKRKIKLSSVTWRRKLQGVCNFYYTRVMDFDIDFDTFDRRALDEGTMVLNGQWNKTTGVWTVKDIASGVPADKDNPNHFIRYTDIKGKEAKVVLNGEGLPADSIFAVGTGTGTTGGPGDIDIQHYKESNFLLLGIPTSL